MMQGMLLQLGIDAQRHEGVRRILTSPDRVGTNLARLEMLVRVGDIEREGASPFDIPMVGEHAYTNAKRSITNIQDDVRQLVATGQLPQTFIDSYNTQLQVFRDGTKNFDSSNYK